MSATLSVAPPAAAVRGADVGEVRTRDQVARLILEGGPMTAAAIAARVDLSPAAVRRHLDALVDEGRLQETPSRPAPHRGRGRPARTYALTDSGRASFPHAYDDLATTALRYLRDTGGPDAVSAFAEHRASVLERTLTGTVPVSAPAELAEALTAAELAAASTAPAELAEALTAAELAAALTAAGYASSTESATSGTQICQHHCPVAGVAAEFPALCEAETRAFERVLGTYVQRLATIAHGDGVCTTHIPHRTVAQSPVPSIANGVTT